MIWLAYRQFRLSGTVALAGLAAIAAALAVTGPHLADLYDESGVAACEAANGDCEPLISAFRSNYRLLQWLGSGLLLLPAVLGVFWGAPLVARELETGTYRMAWTQSITRTRWLAVKMGTVGLGSLAVTGLLSLMLTWWAQPLDEASGDRFGSFSERGIVPIGYAAFAFSLGVASGLVIRRTVPAMALTLIAFVAVWLSVVVWLRPNYQSPFMLSRALEPLPAVAGQPREKPQIFGDSQVHRDDWVIKDRILDPDGQEVTRIGCALGEDCLAGYTRQITYQPADRYWRFQWMETGLYTGLAAVAVAFSFWWLRYRVL